MESSGIVSEEEMNAMLTITGICCVVRQSVCGWLEW